MLLLCLCLRLYFRLCLCLCLCLCPRLHPSPCLYVSVSMSLSISLSAFAYHYKDFSRPVSKYIFPKFPFPKRNFISRSFSFQNFEKTERSCYVFVYMIAVIFPPLFFLEKNIGQGELMHDAEARLDFQKERRFKENIARESKRISTLKYVDKLQHTATHCDTHCNTLQRRTRRA